MTFLYGTERMLAAFEMLRPYLPQQEAALLRAERRLRLKLGMVGLSPRAYLLLQRLYNLVTSRRL